MSKTKPKIAIRVSSKPALRPSVPLSTPPKMPVKLSPKPKL